MADGREYLRVRIFPRRLRRQRPLGMGPELVATGVLPAGLPRTARNSCSSLLRVGQGRDFDPKLEHGFETKVPEKNVSTTVSRPWLATQVSKEQDLRRSGDRKVTREPGGSTSVGATGLRSCSSTPRGAIRLGFHNTQPSIPRRRIPM